MSLHYVLSKRTDGANPFSIFQSLDKLNQSALESRIRKMPYDQFLQTAYWFAVSHVAKARAGMRCQVCNSKDSISVHHRTYDNHGQEHRHMIDLTVLCMLCHGLFHGHTDQQPVIEVRKQQFKKIKGERIVPHTDADIVIPDGDPITLTKDLINACRANGSFTNATVRAFGLTRKDMKHGWVGRLGGTTITREAYRQAQEGRFIYNSGRLI